MRKILPLGVLSALTAGAALAPRFMPAAPQPLRDAPRSALEELQAQTSDQEQKVQSIQGNPAGPQPFEEQSKCGRSMFQDFAGTLNAGTVEKFTLNPTSFLSTSNLKALRSEVGDLSPAESQIAARAAAEPAYVTHRMGIHRLREVLAAGGKKAPYATGGWIPSVEENLFGGNGCLFAAIGPYEGRPVYGEVLLLIADDAPLPSAWASSGSGMKFVCTRHGYDFPCRFDEVEKEDRIAFASGIYSRSDWNARMPLAIVNHLRQKPSKERRAVESMLLSAKDRREFWDIVDRERVGYLEAKIPDFLSLESVSEIRVPPDLLDQVLSWPEAKRWKVKMKGS